VNRPAQTSGSASQSKFTGSARSDPVYRSESCRSGHRIRLAISYPGCGRI
jgi:hypothetical protein